MKTKTFFTAANMKTNESCFKNEYGSSMLELIVGLIFVSIVGLTITWSAISGVRYHKQTEISNIAMNHAVSRVEELSGIFIEELDTSYNEVDEDITTDSPNVKLTRSTNISINSDGSRNILVTIKGPYKFLPKPITYETTFALWES